MRLLVILACIVLAYSFPVERKLDEKFIGRWQLDKSENFDELLAAKGVSWFVRKMILMSSVTKTFQKNINTEDRYDISVKAGSKNVAYEGVKLGEEFKAKGMDGEEHLMNKLVIVALCLVGLSAANATKSLPDKFFGKYVLDHSENFDEYLKAKGYGWFTRQLVTFATFKKEFTKVPGKPGLFDYSNLTSKKDIFYKNVELGKTFVGEGLDSTKHEITFDLVGDTLFEKHHPIEGGESKDETYEYSLGSEFLLVKMEADGVVGKRFYKRVTE